MKTLLLVAAMTAGFSVQAAFAQEDTGPPMADFATLDADGDGGVTLAELEALGAARFAAIDADGDGAVSAQELLAHRAAQETVRATRRAERMIERLDDNGDGVLQIEELHDPRRSVDRMFARADTDEDGVLSAQEFREAQERMGDRHGDDDRRHGHGGDRDREGRRDRG